MFNLKHTTRANPSVPIAVLVRRSPRSSVCAAAVVKNEPTRQGVSVLARVGQCAGAVAIAAILV